MAALCLVVSMAAYAAETEYPIEPFLGRYEGEAIVEYGDGLRERDIGVEIKPHGDGFTVDWVTITRKADGRVKRKAYSVDFVPTHRTNIYASAMRRNMFGKAVPLDPLRGDPYMWAKISGPTLTVYAMFVTDEGGYEMQTYERTLTESGMSLRFSRVRDGEPLRAVTGSLRRIGTVLR